MTETAQVFTHAKWGANLDALKAAGVEINTSTDYAEAMTGVSEPQYGETVLGDLIDSEKAMFAELKKSMEDFERLNREYLGRSVERFGSNIRHSDASKPLHEAVKDNDLVFDSEEEKRAFFKLDRKILLLRSNLHWSICERFNVHEYVVGVRSKFRAVKLKERG